MRISPNYLRLYRKRVVRGVRYVVGGAGQRSSSVQEQGEVHNSRIMSAEALAGITILPPENDPKRKYNHEQVIRTLFCVHSELSASTDGSRNKCKLICVVTTCEEESSGPRSQRI